MTAASRFILSLGPDSFRTNEAMEAARECARYVESKMTEITAHEEVYRAACEAYTNGEWIGGERKNGWTIAKEVYDMLQEACERYEQEEGAKFAVAQTYRDARMTAPDARRNLADKIQVVLAKGGDHYDVADAILSAFPHLGAPTEDGAAPLPFDRDELGRMVREAWVRWAETQPNPKPTWLVPYEALSEPDKEADRQIGEAIARWTMIGCAARHSIGAPTEDVVEAARALSWSYPSGDNSKADREQLADDIAAALIAHAARERADEREACAKECERVRDGGTVPAGAYACAEDMCAAAIRARP